MAQRNNGRGNRQNKVLSSGGSLYQSPNLVKGSTLTNAVGKLPFAEPLGPIIDMPVTTSTTVATVEQSRLGQATGISAIMRIIAHPTYGPMVDANSGVNLASNDLYTYNRAANSGASTYDSPDLMQYILAVDSASMFISNMKRAYGIMKMFNTFNYSIPRAYIRALGFNYDELKKSLPEFRSFINLCISEYNSILIPALPILDYHFNKFKSIIKDSDSDKAQTYVIVPGGYYRFVDANETPNQAGYLEYKQFGYTDDDPIPFTLESMRLMWEEIIYGIRGTGAFLNMSGDVKKAWTQFAQLAEMPEDYTTPIGKDMDALKEIQNASYIHELDTVTTTGPEYMSCMNIYQDVASNQLRQNVWVTIGAADGSRQLSGDVGLATQTRIFNTDSSEPSPEECIQLTTNTVFGSFSAISGTVLLSVVNYGLFIYEKPTIIAYRGGSYSEVAPFATFVNTQLDYTTESAFAHFMSGLSQFDWHPIMYFLNAATATVNSASQPALTVKYALCPEPIVDLDNYTIIDRKTIDRIQRSVTLGAFNVPNNGSITSR